MTNSFYDFEELKNFGFKAIGTNVLISRKASVYSPEKIEIGSNVRVDDFCILSGKLSIGSHIHIAAYTSLCGGNEGIILEDFVNLSRKIEIFAISDDYSGTSMSNPLIPAEFKNMLEAKVVLKKHVVVGPGTIILPGVTIGEGTAIGALSLVKKSTKKWSIYAGIPAKKIKERKKGIVKLEKIFLGRLNSG